MFRESRPSAQPENPRDRRRTPRTEVLDQVQVTVLSQPVMARLREVSLGGFSLETATPLVAGTVHRFQLQLAGGEPFEAMAECVHSTRLALPGRDPMHIAGFEFVPSGPAVALAISELVTQVAARCAGVA